MQQHPQPYFYSSGYDGNPAQVPWEKAAAQWQTADTYNVAGGNNYGPGQVPGGGGQPRVGVGPQQPQQTSHPTPTSTPPGIPGDMSKQQPAPHMNFQPPQRQMNAGNYNRIAMQPTQQLRTAHGRQISYIQNIPMLQNAPGVVPHQFHVMYQPRPTAPPPYHNPGTTIYALPQPAYYNTQAANQFYSQVPQLQQYANIPQNAGPPPQAATQQSPVPMLRPNLVPTTQQQPPASKPNIKRSKAIKIINPETNEEVQVDNATNNNNITPTRSNESSARETPQPGAGVSVIQSDNTVAAEFAAKVAARAMDTKSPAQSPTPDSMTLDCVSESDILHKQPLVVPIISERVSSTLNSASEEFVPRSIALQILPPSEAPVELPPQPPVVVPTVSAETDSPPVEIQRTLVVIKNATVPSAPLTQSPLKTTTKKQKSSENERQQSAVIPLPSQSQAEVRENKKGPKNVQREESTPAPKERREKPRSVMTELSSVPMTIIAPEQAPNPPEAAVVTILPPATKENIVQEVEDLYDNKTQHQNGETAEHVAPQAPIPAPVSVPAPIIESNKTTKRQSGKKTSNKMRDLNRRGTEKEGSEMDAFTTETTIMNEEKDKEISQTPVSSPPPTPPPVVPEPVDKIQEDIEEKEDKLVAAKNEENAKVSALSRPEPEASPIVEDKKMPQLTLRCSYSKDQWSPLNPDGKKKYDRQFLMDLRSDPMCIKKPDKLPDAVVGMLKDISNNRNQNYNMNVRSDISLMPPFFRGQSQRGGGGGGMAPKRGSQQGSKKGSRVIQMSLSLNEEVKLKTSENAWKPTRLDDAVGKNENDKETEELLKNVRGILNKLTPQKFDRLMEKFKILPINSEHRLREVIVLIFEKAVDEPSFSTSYANMCKLCSKLEVTKIVNNVEEKVNFRKLLITRCQMEFEKNKEAELDAEKWQEDINSTTDPEKRKEMQLAYEEKERGIRKKSVGNIRFIGELFKLGMLTPAIMYRCIEHLLSNPAEESLECLCKLLSTIGKDLESGSNNNKGQPQQIQSLNPYFQKMADLSQKKGNVKVSSRVRFMLQDVIDLRSNKWVPRREDNNPKTIEQINKEAERETLEKTIALSQPPPRMNRQNERQDGRKRNQNDPDGWNTVQNQRYHKQFNNTVFESSKMHSVKQDDLTSLQLGGSSAYRFHPSGAKNVENKNSNVFTSSNVFSALQPKVEERKPPQPTMNNRRMTPTPSIEREKERQRMLHGAKETDGRNSRENSVQREKENSIYHQERIEVPAHPKKDDDKPPRQSEEDKAMLKEKLERQIETLVQEYLGGLSSFEDIRTEVDQLFNRDTCGDFVLKVLEIVLEKKAPAQKTTGLLIVGLMDSLDMFSTQVISEQFGVIYESVEEFAIDIPKIWDNQAQIIVPILASQKINFSHFRDACRPVLKTATAAHLLHPVVSLLTSEKGELFVRNLWDASSVSLKDFLPEEVDVNAFVEEKSLQFLIGKCEVSISMDQVQEQLLMLIKNGQSYEKILDFISANVGDRVKENSFICALVTAFCEACITGPNNNELCQDTFKHYKKLIERFVDHKEDKDLVCLSSVHNLCTKLQHPQGLILHIFSAFSEDNLICNESFLKWKDDKHGALESKGVSVLSLKSFFEALEEVDETDGDNS